MAGGNIENANKHNVIHYFKMSDPYFQRIRGLNKKILGISDILTFLLDITERW